MGGSQGATLIEKSVLRSLRYLQDHVGEIAFIHIVGKTSLHYVASQYKKFGFCATVHGFVSNMNDIYSQTNLALSRAGASTIAELTTVGIPMILVPFAKAADNHQCKNASYVANKNAAIVIEEKDLTPQSIAQQIIYLLNDRQKYLHMSCCTEKIAKPHGATVVANYIVKNFLGS